MPRYTFENRKTGEILENEIMTVAERDQWEIDHPDWFQHVAASGFVFTSMSEIKKKLPEDFKDHLRRIKKKHKATGMEDFSSTSTH